MSPKKKLFSSLAAVTVGSLVGAGVALLPVTAQADESKPAGDKGCGEKGCGEKGCGEKSGDKSGDKKPADDKDSGEHTCGHEEDSEGETEE